ncbi:MAG: hypothetical protein M3347_19185 [Armatimonadota bacterium]|nr:hypothetical protein [Armatimonadota bacterium]
MTFTVQPTALYSERMLSDDARTETRINPGPTTCLSLGLLCLIIAAATFFMEWQTDHWQARQLTSRATHSTLIAEMPEETPEFESTAFATRN